MSAQKPRLFVRRRPAYPYLVIKLTTNVLGVRELPLDANRDELATIGLWTAIANGRKYPVCVVLSRGEALHFERRTATMVRGFEPRGFHLVALPQSLTPRDARALQRAARERYGIPRDGIEIVPVRDRPERFTKEGELLLSHNWIALLQGLLDRPGGAAHSRRDLVRAALPYIARYRAPSIARLTEAANGLPFGWVARMRFRNRIEWALTARGREIVEGRVRVIVRGFSAQSQSQRPRQRPSRAE